MDLVAMKVSGLLFLSLAMLVANCVTMPTQTYKECIDGDCLNGKGVKQFMNGLYVGEFKDSLPDGKGVITYWQGHKFIGQFNRGRILGQGKFVHLDGKVEVGNWKQPENFSGLWYHGSASEASAERRADENFKLLIAAYGANAEQAEALLKSELKAPGIEENTGNTILLIATKQCNRRNPERNYEKVINLFVRYRGKETINKPNKDGQTPLMYAAAYCPARIVKLLIENGADVSYGENVRHWLWGHLDHRPLDWAIMNNKNDSRDEIIAILKAAGAQE
jgi:hypothetical protein